MSSLIKYFIRFALFILVQVFVLDRIHLHQMVTPYIYFLFLIWLPFNMGRTQQMLIAFLLGFTLDSFHHQPGFHSAACVLIAYVRPFLINILIPQEGADTNYNEPSFTSMGGILPYMVFISVLTFIHHAWLFFLEAWQFGNIWYFLVKTLLSTVLSLLLIIITELLFVRKQKFRTNTV
ncbi:MAG: rod shape-determining protein MreD [Ferruginibacter sp.]|nr:rod shape-determining protein MreD [Bacteroidota bacterium]MBX2919050.1 rod shape-determining protein MreD [Ferruginibacter sp.]MCB0710227.1 rod shape-determining protein MreD [Chitinophagaceae bacterium]MCC7379736.1 rod shape-determining protein MreD [Chitinophagaceae bacterium]